MRLDVRDSRGRDSRHHAPGNNDIGNLVGTLGNEKKLCLQNEFYIKAKVIADERNQHAADSLAKKSLEFTHSNTHLEMPLWKVHLRENISKDSCG